MGAYEIDRAKAGRTDGKMITKLTGEEVFADEKEEDTNNKPEDQNEVAKRILQKMLDRNKKAEAPVQPNYNKKDETRYTDTRTYGPQATSGAGVVYSREGDKANLQFKREVKQEEKSRGL